MPCSPGWDAGALQLSFLDSSSKLIYAPGPGCSKAK